MGPNAQQNLSSIAALITPITILVTNWHIINVLLCVEGDYIICRHCVNCHGTGSECNQDNPPCKLT